MLGRIYDLSFANKKNKASIEIDEKASRGGGS